MTHIKEQRGIERDALLFLFVLLVIAAWTFYANPNTEMFARFSQDLGVLITPAPFVVLSALCALATPFILRIRRSKTRKWAYITCASPFVAYVGPVGYYAWVTGRPGLGPAVYVLFYLAFVLIARGTFREVGDGAAASTDTPTAS